MRQHSFIRLAVFFAFCAGMGMPQSVEARTKRKVRVVKRVEVEVRKAWPAESVEERFAKVMPTEREEEWRTVGWRTNLMEAREVAQREGKPVFLWIIVGNPRVVGVES